MLDNERKELGRLMERHRRQNEAWWKERLKENDMERQKFRLAWVSHKCVIYMTFSFYSSTPESGIFSRSYLISLLLHVCIKSDANCQEVHPVEKQILLPTNTY